MGPRHQRAAARLLEVGPEELAPGGFVVLYDCVTGATNEIFTMPAVGVAGPVSIYSGALCLVESSGAGAEGAALRTAT